MPDDVPDLTIYARIRAALPIAGAVIASGIDPERVPGTNLPFDTYVRFTTLGAFVGNVFVLGLAAGLLLDPRRLELPHQASRRTTTERRRARPSALKARRARQANR